MNLQRLLDRRIFPLSSGEKQLIAIASVCTMEPKVIVMDEPSANLDSDAMVRLGALLYRLKEAGHTILLSEHHFHYVRASFDRLIFMENGEISAIYSRSEALSLFLSDVGYAKAQASEKRGEIKIRKHAAVIEGHILPDRKKRRH